MKLFIGADHRGYTLKEVLKKWLYRQGHEVIDCGNSVYDNTDDYPDFTFKVADSVAAAAGSRGIVICGSGAGVTIAANKVAGIRAATAYAPSDVVFNREHDDINVLALSADTVTEGTAKEMIEAFVATAYTNEERHVRRLKKISARER